MDGCTCTAHAGGREGPVWVVLVQQIPTQLNNKTTARKRSSVRRGLLCCLFAMMHSQVVGHELLGLSASKVLKVPSWNSILYFGSVFTRKWV